MSLLHKCMYQLLSAARDASGSSMGGLDIRVFTGILSFMAVWLYDFPQGVKEFFAEGSNLQFLIEQVIQSSGVDPLVQGLAAYIMGICFEFNDDSEPSFSR